MSIAEISLILGVTYETINAWIDRWKRMRFSLRNQRDSKAFEKASQHLKRLVSSGKTDVVFLDEAHFSTVGVVGYAWQMTR